MIDLPVSARDTNIVPVRHVPRIATTNDVNQESQASAGNPAVLEDNAVSEEDIEAQIVQPTMAYVIDTSTRSTDRTLFPHVENETISNTLHQRFTNDLLSPEHSICEQDIFEVTLNKHPSLGIGITIVGGDISSKHDFGIFVKSVTVDGPAFQDGRIKPGDRLIAINDQNLEGMQHHEAVTLIKESGDSVRLLISQVRPPGSLKRRDDADLDIDNDDADGEINIEAEKLSVRTHEGDKEELKSFAESAERSDSPNVHNVQSCSSVYKDGNLNKSDSKKLQNNKNYEKNVDPVDRKSSIPDIGSAAVDQDRPLSATVDAHSTLSEVESLYSEMSVSKLPKDLQDDSDAVCDSDTDSDFDDVVNKVIENTYRPARNNATTRNREMDADSDSEEAEHFEVFLEKQNGSFGLNVTGGVNTSVRHGGIYVKSVMKDSAADRNGSIRKGDRILEVDGECLEGFTHKQAVQALCRAPPKCALKLQRSSRSRTSSSSSHMSSRSAGSLQNNAERLRTENRKDNSDLPEDIYGIFVTEENTYTVDLTKGSYGLGFSTVGGHLDQHASLEERVVRIKRVFPIGPAADSRAIHSGDVILAVNRYSVAGLSHTETMSRLRGAGKQVQLLLCHPDPDQLPPLMHLESEESLEITPTDSANNVTDTESDSDSDLEVTPRCEALITPPSGFALSPYPKDGLVMPKIASQPPLPISPPPTLLSTTGSGDSDTPRGEEIEVQIGVAELMDSCRSEMVLIHNAKKNASAQQLFNGSLVVREDSAVTLNSRDVTPVVLESSGEVSPVVLESSREATPCVNVADDITQADNTESETEESEIEDETNELAKSETVSKSQTQNLEITSSLTSTYQSNGSHNDDPEETDKDSLTRTDLSTSVNIDRPEIVKLNGKSTIQYEQADDIETSLVNTGTYTVEQANSDMNRIRDVLDGAIVNKNTLEKNVHNKESLYLNKDYVQISQNVEEISSDSDEETSEEDQDSDADIKRLEEKYIELQNEEDNGDSNYDDEEDDDNKNEGDDANNSVNNSRNNFEENTDIINLDQDQRDISKSINDVYDVHDADDNKNKDDDDDDEEEELEEDNSDYKNISDNEDEKDNNNGDDDDSSDHSEKENTTERTQFARRENNGNSLQNSESPVIGNAEDEIEHDMRDESDESISDHSSVRESLSPTLETQSLNPGEFEVTLTKPEGRGLGFTVAGGAKTTGGCYVKAVLQNPALSDGNLKPGDKLIMVNGIDMRPLNHFEAVSVLRETQDEVTIRVYRAELAGEDTGQAGVDNFPTSQGLAELGIISDQPYDDGNEQDSLRSITSEGSYTDRDDSGALQDLIASLEESLDQARISNTQPDNSGNQTEIVLKDKSVKEMRIPRALRSTPTAEASVYEIDLEKPVGGGLGISLVTAQTQNQTGIFISTITPGGVADLDGRLQVGDKILRINGESLIGMNHTKAATMLRSSQGQLSLTVSRKGRKPVLMESSEDLNRSSISDLEGHSENEGEGDSSDAKVNAKKGDCEDGEELENDDSLRDVSDVNASLSITQLVPSDIEDDDVDDLVNKTEHILGDAKVYSDSESDINDSDLRDEVTAKKAHQYLSASEVIDYHSQEIDEDTEQENDPESSKGMTGNEQEPDSETQDLDKSAIEGEIQVYSDKCWCNLLRSLDIVVPDEVTADWLLNLSLVTVPDNMKAALVNIVSNLQEKIDKDDPNEEFKQLRNVPITDDCTAATMPHNRPKNRFRNVLPFDVNRVKISDDEETDYINASYVQLEVGEAVCDYIVCQGPLPETTDDFWGMIWQEEVTVIAMLTLDMEAMKVKCHRYWPDSVDTPIEVCGGKLRLSLLYQNSLEDFDIRSILVENLESGDNRCVYHLNYTTWPDHGTPASAVPLLQCMRLCHLYRSSGPVVVHCSAGIGRSGTFITIDVALAHVELGYEFDILEIVQELRRQRQGMIQTRDQYMFCYTALVEALTDTPS